jgi:hypothetical protein
MAGNSSLVGRIDPVGWSWDLPILYGAKYPNWSIAFSRVRGVFLTSKKAMAPPKKQNASIMKEENV